MVQDIERFNFGFRWNVSQFKHLRSSPWLLAHLRLLPQQTDESLYSTVFAPIDYCQLSRPPTINAAVSNCNLIIISSTGLIVCICLSDLSQMNGFCCLADYNNVVQLCSKSFVDWLVPLGCLDSPPCFQEVGLSDITTSSSLFDI